ncbi:MAG: 1-acyl-sn-glycerol-3-phosphate acyltransferase [Thermoplasmatota archaeon]
MAKPRARMRRTIFDTPFLSTIMKWIGRTYVRITGWEEMDNRNGEENFVAIFAPHTSAWDFVDLVMLALDLDIKSYWLGKHSLFKGPLDPLLRYMGGLPIDRGKRSNTVEQVVDYFNEKEDMVFTLAPEGTRKPVEKWRSGFYHIAVGAGVPIAIVQLDHGNKRGGIHSMFYPTGDLDGDMKSIKARYRGVLPRHPDRFKL